MRGEDCRQDTHVERDNEETWRDPGGQWSVSGQMDEELVKR